MSPLFPQSRAAFNQHWSPRSPEFFDPGGLFLATTSDLRVSFPAMGKNKNKGFDLAKRQEKILKRMAKPLYRKTDDSVYLVITQPFGMQPTPAARGTVDIDRFSSWISWVFQEQSVVEIVYTMSTVSQSRSSVYIHLDGLRASLRGMKSLSRSQKG